MRRIFLSAIAAVTQMAQLGMRILVKDQNAKDARDRYVIPARFRKHKRGQLPRVASRVERENAVIPRALLILDRTSSFKKMRRAVNQGAVPREIHPTEIARHEWSRRPKAARS